MKERGVCRAPVRKGKGVCRIYVRYKGFLDTCKTRKGAPRIHVRQTSLFVGHLQERGIYRTLARKNGVAGHF